MPEPASTAAFSGGAAVGTVIGVSALGGLAYAFVNGYLKAGEEKKPTVNRPKAGFIAVTIMSVTLLYPSDKAARMPEEQLTATIMTDLAQALPDQPIPPRNTFSGIAAQVKKIAELGEA